MYLAEGFNYLAGVSWVKKYGTNVQDTKELMRSYKVTDQGPVSPIPLFADNLRANQNAPPSLTPATVSIYCNHGPCLDKGPSVPYVNEIYEVPGLNEAYSDGHAEWVTLPSIASNGANISYGGGGGQGVYGGNPSISASHSSYTLWYFCAWWY
jgi:hypothetical protein